MEQQVGLFNQEEEKKSCYCFIYILLGMSVETILSLTDYTLGHNVSFKFVLYMFRVDADALSGRL